MATITCPTDCTSQPPDVSTNICTINEAFGEIETLFFCKEGDGFDGTTTVWTSADDWNAKLAITGDDKIRPLYGIGDKPVPEKTEIKASMGRFVFGEKKHTLNFRIDDVSDTNYDLLRQLECGGTWRVWFRAGGYLFGGNSGIVANIEFDNIIPESNQELQTLTGVISWESKFHPERTAAPEGLNF